MSAPQQKRAQPTGKDRRAGLSEKIQELHGAVCSNIEVCYVLHMLPALQID